MCGIAGLFRGSAFPAGAAAYNMVEMMCDAIAHRGPDGSGVWEDSKNGVCLGHRRLSIVDLSPTGAQPMASDDGSVFITYNGMIYHFDELRRDLISAGRKFRGSSDTEVIANGIAHWGLEGLCRRIDGMFAFAAWLPASRKLFLVRDRLGKKPLYWSQTSSGIVFGSELSALMRYPDLDRTIDQAAATSFLRTGHIADPHTIFTHVKKVAAGEILAFSAEAGLHSTTRYWAVEDALLKAMPDQDLDTLELATGATETCLMDAVQQRMIADVPYGAFLSGGIDSSLIVALMQRQAKKPVNTYSIGYRSSTLDESEDAAAVARHLGTDHHTFFVEAKDAIDTVYDLPKIYSEPFADPSQIPTAMISRLAREQVKVVLTGDGGDEVFGGYNRHIAAAGFANKLDRLPLSVRSGLALGMRSFSPSQWDKIFGIVPSRFHPRQPGEKMHKLAAQLGLGPWQKYLQLTSQWPNFGDVCQFAEHDFPQNVVETFAQISDPVARLRYMDLVSYLTGDVLTKVDRAAMANGLEARAPLLDYRLVDMSWRIPSNVHIRGGKGKMVLRSILEKHVPKALYDRPKSGFGVPIDAWLRGPLRDWAEDLLAPVFVDGFGLLDGDQLREVWNGHISGKANAQYALWNVLMFEAWRREFISKQQAGLAA
jgi:asparagine synthase (glutamine-hydrolysing)